MNKYNENYVRIAAYYNWQNAGCPSGKDEYFWNEAINQLYGSSCTSCKKATKSTKSSVKSAASKSGTAKKTSAKTSKK